MDLKIDGKNNKNKTFKVDFSKEEIILKSYFELYFFNVNDVSKQIEEITKTMLENGFYLSSSKFNMYSKMNKFYYRIVYRMVVNVENN
jgi:uncharacterized protein YvpB